MLPMSVQCNTCGEYIYRGKKFNARKEEAVGEEYLGLKLWRFYFKCTTCCAEITFKTDPQNSDYTCEHGASRNFEPWRQQEETKEKEKEAKHAEEHGDVMKKLENRTSESKREMDILDALEEIKELNARHRRVDTDALLDSLVRKDQQKQQLLQAKQVQEDEDEVRRIWGPAGGTVSASAEDPTKIIKRVVDPPPSLPLDCSLAPPPNLIPANEPHPEGKGIRIGATHTPLLVIKAKNKDKNKQRKRQKIQSTDTPLISLVSYD